MPTSKKRIEQARRALCSKLRELPPEFTVVLDEATQAKHRAITDMSATQLASAIARGDLTAEQAVVAFGRRMVLAHLATNCLTECLLREALDRARAMDAEYQRLGAAMPRGALFGVPVSIKEQLLMAGTDTTLGHSVYLGKPAATNAVLIDVLLREGAIIIGKTNVPQFLLSFECSNPVFGRTENPVIRGFTCGGSSGGEAALLKLRGSALGIGTDIGGSLRIPAHFSGIYSLKPSKGRIPNLGVFSADPGQEAIAGVAGPMGNSVDDLDLLCRATLQPQHLALDPFTVPLPFRAELASALPRKSLRVGYYTSDGFTAPCPAVARAVETTVRALERAGHTVVPFAVPRPFDFMDLAYGMLLYDGGRKRLEPALRGGDAFEPWARPFVWLARTFRVVRWALARVLALLGERRAHLFVSNVHAKSVAEMHALQARRNEYAVEFHNAAWVRDDLDCIVCPVSAMVAIPHGTFLDVAGAASHTLLYNLLDYSVGVVPVTEVRRSDAYAAVDPVVHREQFRAGSTARLDRVHQRMRDLYDPVAMEGLPVGVQVVGKRLDEERVLAYMREVERCLKVA
ncbi:hypothetical protein H9P43_001242 [Blastocladiella emersonii ATCC 22665]|nr:hypothetical protein H9P43_001242 [Blastocladiella emersonii ATCC 22665]